ncbi:methyltransferase [Pseudomonas protegens]|uniref:methyltransferase n=2 Tax=Pseudomonas protegens TaxID=380021 RepID=UPI00301CD6A3
MAKSVLNELNCFELIQASYAAHALYFLTKIEIFEFLIAGPKTLDELNQLSKAKSDILNDLLMLAMKLKFIRKKDEKYLISRKGLQLTKASKSWFRPYLLVWGAQLAPATIKLEEHFLTGDNAFKLAHQDTIWDYYNKNPEASKVFVEFMHGVTNQSLIPDIVEELIIGDAKSLVDVAGGTGSLACALALKYEKLSCIICDQPSNKINADRHIQSLELENCQFIGTNIFGAIPPGHDVYTIKHVLHDWDNSNVIQILTSIAKAMRLDSRLVIIEGLLDREFSDSFDNPEFIHTRNFEQRVWTPGQVRSTKDFQSLCSQAGLRIESILPSRGFDMNYIECLRSPN